MFCLLICRGSRSWVNYEKMYNSLPLMSHGVWRRLRGFFAELGAHTEIQTSGARNIKSPYSSWPLRFKANCYATFSFTSISNWRKRLHRLSLRLAVTFVHVKWMHLKLNMIARRRRNQTSSFAPSCAFTLTDWRIDSFSCRCAKDDLLLWQAFTSDPLATLFVTPSNPRRLKRQREVPRRLLSVFPNVNIFR